MARRAVIERDELFETANRLSDEGKDVTALELHKALGGGSLTTIYRYWGEWQATRPKSQTMAGSADMPEPVKGVFAAAWRTAQAEASRDVEAVKQKAADEVAQAKKQFEEALEAIGQLEEQQDEGARLIDELKARVTELEPQFHAAQRENAALKATNQQLTERVENQRLQIEKKEMALEDARLKHEKEMQQLKSEAKEAQDKVQEEVNATRSKLAEREIEIDQLKHEREDLAARTTQAHQQVAKIEEAAARDREARETAVKEAAEFKGQAQALKSQNSELLSRLSEPPKKSK